MIAQSPSIKRLRMGLVTLAVFFLVGVAGYSFFGMSLLDAVYMVVVTFSTVGNRGIQADDPSLAFFTILMIVFGVSTTLYIVGVFVQMMVEGEINRAIGQRRVTNEIERLTDHVIVCGYGRTGEILAGELSQRKRPFVVVDKDPERINEATAEGHLALTDDATEEQALIDAGIHRARTVVASLPSDAENVFLTLTARNLRSDLQIIARGGVADDGEEASPGGGGPGGDAGGDGRRPNGCDDHSSDDGGADRAGHRTACGGGGD